MTDKEKLLETNIELCDICHHHHVELPPETPNDTTLYKLADLYKVFGDPPESASFTPFLEENFVYVILPNFWE